MTFNFFEFTIFSHISERIFLKNIFPTSNIFSLTFVLYVNPNRKINKELFNEEKQFNFCSFVFYFCGYAFLLLLFLVFPIFVRGSGKSIFVANPSINSSVTFPTISPNGRFVAWVDQQSNSATVFVKDLETNSQLSIPLSCNSSRTSFSDVYTVGGQLRFKFVFEQCTQVYLHEIQVSSTLTTTNSTPTLISSDASGNPANANSSAGRISRDGNYVVFGSGATNLIPCNPSCTGIVLGRTQIFRKNLSNNAVDLVSGTSATAAGDNDSKLPAVNYDGSKIVYASKATNLVTGDTNGKWDVYVRDFNSSNELISKSTNGVIGDFDSGDSPFTTQYTSDISDDGNFVAFISEATTFETPDSDADISVYLRDRQAATTTLVSKNISQSSPDRHLEPTITADGRFISFGAQNTNLIVYDRLLASSSQTSLRRVINFRAAS